MDGPSSTAATGRPALTGRTVPERPLVVRPTTAPIIANVPPPASIRVSQFFWILAIAIGGFVAVYSFIIRSDQLPLIADRVEAVTEGRTDATYASAADIVFWVFFTTLVIIVLAQIVLLVSFMGRRRRIRWWQFATWMLSLCLLLVSRELVAVGDRGEVLFPLLALLCGLVAIALLFSVLPKAITWSARQYDLRPVSGPVGGSDGGF